MELLAAAVVILGAIAMLNLLLTFGVIRRLREHNKLLALGAAANREASAMLDVGEPIGPFSARTADGHGISADQLASPSLVGVFAVGCETCEEKLPVFVKHAAAFRGGRQGVLAVVVASDDAAAASYLDALAEVAVVVREDRDGSVAAALGVTGYPAFAFVESGLVRASAFDPGLLPLPSKSGFQNV